MERLPLITGDGSPTVYIPALNVTYHSRHGALQESRHVFIEAGLRPALTAKESAPLRILEMGFGTGLNALLTLQEAEEKRVALHYTALELYPLSAEEADALSYDSQLSNRGSVNLYRQLHRAPWESDIRISPYFTLNKRNISLLDFTSDRSFDLIYFDAFAPAAQPDLWTEEVFTLLYRLSGPGAILVTYCSKGSVRRALQTAGWKVEKLAGPPGKREMVRGVRSRESCLR
jgi:tRNA U34 5-methylaminomethyl-2-thiouridine-forming methyltransferase MnmC